MTATEFPRPVRIDELGVRDRVIEIEATDAERAALARRCELQAIGRLIATVRLRRIQGGRYIRLAAELDAEVVQTCVVTLDPVPATVRSVFEILYDPGAAPAGREVVIGSGEMDVEPLEGDTIDVGEAVAEELSLSLDPYPRAPGAAVEAPGGGDQANRPFERLARLKRSH
jgi:uncharacterized metal-binding protein YceD (DUF177 family)